MASHLSTPEEARMPLHHDRLLLHSMSTKFKVSGVMHDEEK